MDDLDQETTTPSAREAPFDTVRENLRRTEGVMNHASRVAHVSSVFGAPQKYGDKTVIPVARVFTALGFGMGSGVGPQGGEEAQTESAPDYQERIPGSGAGGGGGAISMAAPAALIEVTDGQVEIKPVTNTLVISIFGIVLAGWNVYWVLRTVREWLATRRT